MEEDLYHQLLAYSNSDAYPFHMPGHKRNLELMREVYGGEMSSLFLIDITEIDGFDDLHHPEGILKDAMQRAAAAVGAEKSYFVVNGSSAGILASIYAACKTGDYIGMARNCHRSAAHGIQLMNLMPIYSYPQIDPKLGITLGITSGIIGDNLGITSKKQGINPKNIPAVIITSPTYEGIVSDVRGIAEIVHEYGAILIVDEAHGAHLSFGKKAGLPESAVSQGADLVIQSLHKTLPAMTQSAIVHVCSNRVNQKRLEQGLRIFETSSPSYVMMAGMDSCMKYMAREGERRLEILCKWLDFFYEESKKWKELWFLTAEGVTGQGTYFFDRTKIVFGAKRKKRFGKQLHKWLMEEYHLQPEMSVPEYVVLMTTVGDTKEGFERLIRAMKDINRRLSVLLEDSKNSKAAEAVRRIYVKEEQEQDLMKTISKAKIAVRPQTAAEGIWERVSLEESVNRISAEMAYIYPPGIPFLMPGEWITEEHIKIIGDYQKIGVEIHGLEDETGNYIRVVK